MEQYISKSALVAEIERLIKKNELYLDDNVPIEARYQKTGAYSVLNDLLHFIGTLEAKDVDLMIHTIIAEGCDWLAICTDLSHDLIEDCRNLMLDVKDEQLKPKEGEEDINSPEEHNIMKELSIEEKAYRYDEAIGKAKEMIKAMTDIGGVAKADDIQYLFPELVEDEDERVRKALMQNLKERFGTKGNMGEGLDMPDVLAWLEKQGKKSTDNIEKPWSEEDEEILKDIITDVKFEGYNNDMQANSYKKINWLKSLRPQSQ